MLLSVFCTFYTSVYQTVVRGPWVVHGGCVMVRDGFGRKSTAKIVSYIERMKNTPIHVCAKTVFFGWPSVESRRISFFINSWPWAIILVIVLISAWKRCGYGNFNRRYNVSPIYLHAILCLGNFTKVFRVCADRLWSGPRLPDV
jgi:hypothetical protein